MFRKLRTQLLLVFLIFAIINVIIVIVYVFQSKQKNRVEKIEDYIHQMEVLMHSDVREINNFLTHESQDTNFFFSQESPSLKKHTHQLFIIDIIKKRLINADGFNAVISGLQLSKFAYHLGALDSIVNKVSDLYLQRGFKNYGVEGKMLEFANGLENNCVVPNHKLLMIRKHEKDYIIHGEEIYVDFFNTGSQELIQLINDNDQIFYVKKEKLINEIKYYAEYFNELVSIDKQIGVNNNTALKGELNVIVRQLFSDVELLKQNCNIYKLSLYKKLEKLSLYFLLTIVLGSLILSFRFSKMVTHRISQLSKNATVFINSCFTINDALNIKESDDEVGMLVKSYELLKLNIINQIQYLEVKVNERTEEINAQKELMEVQNKKLTDSVKYALNIQEAILPHPNYISQTFKEHFILNKPKDVVSGDFYWCKHIQRKKEDYSVFVVADCTGHGVPGAFMSMLGVAFLNEIVVHKNISDSADILNQLRQKVIENLAHQDNSKIISDGLDMGLVLVNHKENVIQFSGANHNLTLIQNNELVVIKGDKMPIGQFVKSDVLFAVNTIEYQKGDQVYLFSDGYPDQHDGDKGRKYLIRNFRKLLLKASSFPMEKQRLILEHELNKYKGDEEQTDDILVAGIKL